jgi:hypothetical protein
VCLYSKKEEEESTGTTKTAVAVETTRACVRDEDRIVYKKKLYRKKKHTRG